MALIIFLYALAIGSFLNVCIYRIPRGVSIVWPRSFCPNCQKNIPWHDMIPVLSYLILRGRCRFCRAAVGIQYPVVEISTALLALVFYKKYGLTGDFFKIAFLGCLLIIIAWIDGHHRRIPDKLSIFGIIAGLAWAFFYGKAPLLHAGLGMLIGGGVLFPIAFFYPRGMGMGDVKLLAMIGAFVGVKGVLYTLFIGSALGAVIGLGLLYWKTITRKTQIPFGPFLAVGAIITLLFVL